MLLSLCDVEQFFDLKLRNDEAFKVLVREGLGGGFAATKPLLKNVTICHLEPPQAVRNLINL